MNGQIQDKGETSTFHAPSIDRLYGHLNLSFGDHDS
jgi:hypothetical protein